MAILLGFPVLGLLTVLQSALISRLQLYQGYADLIFLAVVAWGLQPRVRADWQWALIAAMIMGFTSGVPFFASLVGYVLIVFLTRGLRMVVWQTPVLSMFVAVFVGTLLMHSVDWVALRLVGDPLPFLPALQLITLPTLFLNMVFAVVFWGLFQDLANMLYPAALET